MSDFIAYVVENWDTLFAVITSVVGTFALIATLTPNKSDDKISLVVLDVVNFLGANTGKAKNKDE